MVNLSSIYWLRTQWQELVYSYNDRPERAMEWFGTLMDRYTEFGRFYHNEFHIDQALEISWNITSHELSPGADIRNVEFAIFFHDAVYDPKADDNEVQSCEIAEKCLYDMRFPDSFVKSVKGLIMVTKYQDPISVYDRIMLDSDNSILAKHFSVYVDYSEAIRKEYGFLTDEQWRDGRSAWIKKQLDKPRIFHGRYLASKENEARNNLRQELHYLNSGKLGFYVDV